MAVTVPSFAKINLDLRVLHKRPDNYHELRTIFQTVSLKDNITLAWRKTRTSKIDLQCEIDIADNLVVRAARAVLDCLKVTGSVSLKLDKRLPMGAGMGGGSSNAAAVLIALPALIGKPIPYPELTELASRLGSDVPFFLHGGTAIGVGRGTELYPLADLPPSTIVIVTSGVHVSTAEAYGGLNRTLTIDSSSPILREFQTIAWELDGSRLDQLPLINHFEDAVFGVHPELRGYVRKLRRLGARPALMTGSGSALFGVFGDSAKAKAAADAFPAGMAQVCRFVSRKQYRRAWVRAMGPAASWSLFARGHRF